GDTAEGVSSPTAAAPSTVRSAPASMRSAFRGAFATGAAEPSCRHVLDRALAVEIRSLVLDDEPAEVEDGDPVRDLEHVIQVVRDDHHRKAAVAQSLAQVEHLARLDDAESR